DLAGKSQRQVAHFGLFQNQFEWRLVQLATLAKFGNRVADGLIERFITAFARQPADDVAGRIDQVARRPGVDAVCMPDLEVGIVNNRVLDLVTENYATNV